MSKKVILTLLVSAAIVPAIAACASAAPVPSLPPEQASLVDATCSQIMRFQKGEWHYSGCSEALTDSLMRKMASRIMVQSYEDCTNAGLKEETPEFATCVLDRRKAHSASEVEKITASQAIPTASLTLKPFALDRKGRPKGFFDVPPEQQTAMEDYACAQLGLDPGSSPFRQCTAQLDAEVGEGSP